MLSDKVDDATFRNYEKKLQKMFFDITNEMAIDVHFYNNQEWIAIFENKMPVYELFIEYYNGVCLGNSAVIQCKHKLFIRFDVRGLC